MTLTVTPGHGGQWIFTITDDADVEIARSTPYLNRCDARRAADDIVQGFGSGAVVDRDDAPARPVPQVPRSVA